MHAAYTNLRILQILDNEVVNVRTKEKEGYWGLQLGGVNHPKPKNVKINKFQITPLILILVAEASAGSVRESGSHTETETVGVSCDGGRHFARWNSDSSTSFHMRAVCGRLCQKVSYSKHLKVTCTYSGPLALIQRLMGNRSLQRHSLE